MISFVLVAIIVSGALLVHDYHWRRGAAGQHVLAVLPAALLFAILPIPIVMLSTIRGFQRIAERQGTGSYAAAGTLSLEINRALWLGSVGLVIAMVAASLLQWHASKSVPEDVAELPWTWREWFLLVSGLLVVPAAFLTYIAWAVPHTLVGAMEMMTDGPVSRLPSSELGNLSAKISTLLMTGFAGGLILVIADLLAAAGAVWAANGIRQPRRTPRSVAFVLMVVFLGAAWNVVRLPLERRWIERVASAAQHRIP